MNPLDNVHLITPDEIDSEVFLSLTLCDERKILLVIISMTTACPGNAAIVLHS